jgi:hypothetical protein
VQYATGIHLTMRWGRGKKKKKEKTVTDAKKMAKKTEGVKTDFFGMLRCVVS